MARSALAQGTDTDEGWRELYLAPVRAPRVVRGKQWLVRWDSNAAACGHLIIVDHDNDHDAAILGSIHLPATGDLAGEAQQTAEGWVELSLVQAHAQAVAA